MLLRAVVPQRCVERRRIEITTDDGVAELSHQDQTQLAAGDLLVEAHQLAEVVDLHAFRRTHGQAAARDQFDAAKGVGSRQPIQAYRHVRRHAQTDRNRLARSEEHTSELQSLMRISYAVFCLKKQKKQT